MPLPLALIGAGIATLGGLTGNVMTNAANKQQNSSNRKWQEKMYWLQEEQEAKKWDKQNSYNQMLWNQQNVYNEQQWHKMNDYNSPMSQMTRFKEAGLNPALIYGQSNSTPAIATAQFGRASMGKGSVGSPQVTPMDYNLNLDKGVMVYNSLREADARIDNLHATNDVLKQEAAKKAVETAGIGISNARSQVDYDIASSLQETSIDAAKAALRKTNLEMDLALQRNEREAALNSSNIREAYERIANMRGQRVNQELDAQLKQLDINLKAQGIQPGDNVFLRILAQLFNRPAVQGAVKSLID